MHRTNCLWLLCALALSGLLAACGEDGPTGRARAADTGAVPPTWSGVRDEHVDSTVFADIRAESPCRLRLAIAGTQARADVAGERTLARGETVRLWWRIEAPVRLEATVPVPAEDRAAGRTEPHAVAVHYGFTEGPAQRRLIVLGTRPAAGRVLEPLLALPPQAPQALSFDTPTELGATAVLDGGGPELRLVAADEGARLKGRLEPATGERAQILRLVLYTERMGP